MAIFDRFPQAIAYFGRFVLQLIDIIGAILTYILVTYRGKCTKWRAIPYVEVVEEALCFGWIDSTLKRLPDGRLAQRLSPRREKSHWTQLNIDRCKNLEAKGLMTEAGRKAYQKAIE